MSNILYVRRSEDRGFKNLGWLSAYHSFSFADYYDRNFMGFRDLRVINEDTVAPSTGFEPHSHNNMEIITYVLEGVLHHTDSMGNSGIIKPKQFQYMSAGSGVTHSEMNGSKEEKVHLLQIWIKPKNLNTIPKYQDFIPSSVFNSWQLIAGNSSDSPMIINSENSLHHTEIESHKELSFGLQAGKFYYLHIISGTVKIHGEIYVGGDAIAFNDQGGPLDISALSKSECILFELT